MEHKPRLWIPEHPVPLSWQSSPVVVVDVVGSTVVASLVDDAVLVVATLAGCDCDVVGFAGAGVAVVVDGLTTSPSVVVSVVEDCAGMVAVVNVGA